MGFTNRIKDLLKSSGQSGSGEDAVMSTIPAGFNRSVNSGEQQVVYGSLIVNGSITVGGTLRVYAWPSAS